jgi:predicted transcriptional regulator of viral defense system
VSEQYKIPISKVVNASIAGIPEGMVFDYSYFNMPKSEEITLAKALSRLTSKGIIERLAKGKYYKPRNTIFGKLKPEENEIIKSLTYKGEQLTGYLTGIALYNRLGLTTQVPNILTVATNNILPTKKVNGYTVKYSKRNVEISEDTVYLLQLLDALKDIRKIPDAYVDQSFTILLERIKELNPSQQKNLLELARKYNPATRALTGALFEEYISGTKVANLKESLNGLSQYTIGLSKNLLPNQSDWNII